MSLYPKYDVYKILLEISGLKKSVVINDLSLKPMSLNPKFTVVFNNSRLPQVDPSVNFTLNPPVSIVNFHKYEHKFMFQCPGFIQ